jgi:hypothetical protein
MVLSLLKEVKNSDVHLLKMNNYEKSINMIVLQIIIPLFFGCLN